MAPKARTCTICNAPIPDTASHNATTCGDDNCKRERSRRASAAYRARHPGRHNENVAHMTPAQITTNVISAGR